MRLEVAEGSGILLPVDELLAVEVAAAVAEFVGLLLHDGVRLNVSDPVSDALRVGVMLPVILPVQLVVGVPLVDGVDGVDVEYDLDAVSDDEIENESPCARAHTRINHLICRIAKYSTGRTRAQSSF